MFSRPAIAGSMRVAVACLVLAAALPQTVSAQSAEELRARLADLGRRVEAAEAQARRVRDSLNRTEQIDTMGMGEFTVVIQSVNMSLAREATSRAHTLLRGQLGSDIELLDGLTLRVIVTESGVAVGPSSHSWSVGGGLRADDAIGEIARIIVDGTYEVLDQERNLDMRNWLTIPTPLADAEHIDRKKGYTDLATSPFGSAEACLDGDITECRRALGLAPTTNALLDWYDAADRRVLTLQRRPPDSRGSAAYREVYEACLAGADESCVTFLDRGVYQAPLPVRLREALVQQALATGEQGAYGRMRRTEGSLEQRLAAAAGVSGDSLITLWRESLLEAAGQPTTATGAIGLTAIFWALAFAALGLRSTRWR
jgi:hypothetical protein